MLTVSSLMGLRLGAPDGDVGRLQDVLFDDDGFGVRWFVAWPCQPRRRGLVLVKPGALRLRPGPMVKPRFTFEAGALRAGLAVEADLPVSRRSEHRGFADFFRPCDISALLGNSTCADRRLQSCREVVGYEVFLHSELLGRIHDVMLDEQSWSIKSLLVKIATWRSKYMSLISVADVLRFDWEDATVRVMRNGTLVKV